MLIERLSEKWDLVSGQAIDARDLQEAKLRALRQTEDENKTAQGGQAHKPKEA